MTPKELKKWLVSEGFQVYRTLASGVVLAERARENLILDSGVRVSAGERHTVRLVLRETTRDLPSLEPAERFQRLEGFAREALERGYRVVERSTNPVVDPGDAEVVLDTWYEVAVERSGVERACLVSELHFALKQGRRGARER